MKPVEVAGRYARALAEIAGENDAERLQALCGEIDLLAASVGADAALVRFFDSPTAEAAQKGAVLDTLFKRAGLSDLAVRFMRVLVENRRVGALPYVARELQDMRDRAAGIVPAEATVAAPLGAAEQAAMEKALEAMTGKKVRLQVKVDASILGGARTRVGSRVYDGTLLSRLQLMHRRLARA
jgi:F-type H+-transporting ATPase subunit delta